MIVIYKNALPINEKYSTMIEMKYRHNLKYDYPDNIHGHMIAPKQVRKDNLDKNYPYYRHDFIYNVARVFTEIFFIIVGIPFVFFKFGLRVKNKHNRKALKKMLRKKQGLITICNHIFDEDYIAIRTAMAPTMGYVSLWKDNHLRRMGRFIRLGGSIPVPRDDSSATLSMMRGVEKCLKDGHWLHIYPEASMFYYYQEVRPFVDGAFVFAIRNNTPIVPMAFSYRPAKGLYKLWKKDKPLINLSFGEPIYPDPKLGLNNRIEDLKNRCHAAVSKLMEEGTPEV